MADRSSHARPTRIIVQRATERRRLSVPGRVTWRDARGMPRFATVVTRDISDNGVYLECRAADAIPLYRLVYLQVERATRGAEALPMQLRAGRVLTAVWRVAPCRRATGTPSGYALRFLMEPQVPSAQCEGDELAAIAV